MGAGGDRRSSDCDLFLQTPIYPVLAVLEFIDGSVVIRTLRNPSVASLPEWVRQPIPARGQIEMKEFCGRSCFFEVDETGEAAPTYCGGKPSFKHRSPALHPA